MEEQWLPLKEFPGYSVSNLGQVMNDHREALVKTSVTGNGVAKVGLMRDGKQHTRSLKILVAGEFMPQEDPLFNTLINLDGNTVNNRIDNLMWRPRWFAWKYHRQMEFTKIYSGVGPVQDAKTKEVYEDVVEAAMINGLLFEEIQMAIVDMIPVFPTWHLFEWA
jgi:hypothetical protein